jgi:hypothetical protein
MCALGLASSARFRRLTSIATKIQELGADATVTAVLRELKETEIKDKRADYEATADKGAKCGDLKALAAAGEKFAVIYADPPWEFKVYSGKDKQRSVERYYDTSSIEAIKALPVAPLAADAFYVGCHAGASRRSRSHQSVGLRVQDGGVHMGQAKQERRGIVHRNGLLDPIERGDLPIRDPRIAAAHGQRRVSSHPIPGWGAQRETARSAPPNRAPFARALSRTVRPIACGWVGDMGK